jgi:hypothetical protein
MIKELLDVYNKAKKNFVNALGISDGYDIEDTRTLKWFISSDEDHVHWMEKGKIYGEDFLQRIDKDGLVILFISTYNSEKFYIVLDLENFDASIEDKL